MKVPIVNLRQVGTLWIESGLNVTLFFKDFSTFLCASCPGVEDNLPYSDFTNLAECPLTNK